MGVGKLPCHWCEEEAHGSCSWPTEQWVEREAGELQVGDHMRRHNETAADLLYDIRVRDLTKLDEHLIRVDVILKPKVGLALERRFETNTFCMVRVIRKAPCGKQCCENHLQARAPGVYVCREHWDSWLKIA